MATKRVVVKLGTSSLTYPNGRLQLGQIERLVRDISDMANAGHEVTVVSSGAIGAGMSRLGLKRRPQTIPDKQAVAAVGQGLLMQVYSRVFSEYGHVVAQVLLTADDLQQRQRYLNCRHTLETLLNRAVIPIINENDSVAVDEIRFGDNDTLSALVSTLISADLLVLLSDIDGVYDKNPKVHPDAKLVPVIHAIDDATMALAKGAGPQGTGGMYTKFQAARIAKRSGIPMVIANGGESGLLARLAQGEQVGTLFTADAVPLPSRKRWLAFYTHPHGQLLIDPGAVQALEDGRSLLPIGVIKAIGSFAAGDLVQVIDHAGLEVAKGLTNYAASQVNQISGKTSAEAEKVLANHPYNEVIHRDNLVLTKLLSQ